jgi:hypothetical protein
VRLLLPLALLISAAAAQVTTYPAPPGEPASPDFRVTADGAPVFVATTLTLRDGPVSYGSFELGGPARIVVECSKPPASARILPASYGLAPTLDGPRLSFTLDRPRNLTIEVDGRPQHCLHLFANPPETDAPRPDDPNVLYFGPGIHDLKPVRPKSGQTIYLAGGAIVRPTIPPDEKPTNLKDWSGVKNWVNLIEAHGADHLTIRGPGVLDLSQLPWHARTAIVLVNCHDCRIEGLTILDAPAWDVAIFSCHDMVVRGVKQIARRENSDGIDLCNSQKVLVEDCWLRNNDDEVCLKCTSPAPAPATSDIVVQRCVIWNERARGLGITSETRRDIRHAVFRDCDIIHDFSGGGDCAALAVLVSDSGTMSDIRFEDIRIEQCQHTLVNMWVGADFWGHDKERGHVDGVTFKDIRYTGPGAPPIRINGCDAGHLIENVTFDHLWLNGKLAHTKAAAHLTVNAFTRNLRIVSDEPPPAAAPTVTAQALVGDPAIKLTWTAVAGPESGIDHYNVYRDEQPPLAVVGTEFSDAGLAEETAYRYRVAAVSGAGLEGPASATLTVTTLPDTAPPRVLAAEALAPTRVRLTFSQPVTPTATFDGAAAPQWSADGRSVELTVPPLTSGQAAKLTISGLTDRAKRPNTAAVLTVPVLWQSHLVGEWRLDETAGEIAHDAGSGHLDGHLHQLAPAAWRAGGLAFDGDRGWVELPADPRLNALQAGSYTIEVNFYPTALPPGTDRSYNASSGLVMKQGYHEGLLYDRLGHFVLCHWLAGDAGSGDTTLGLFAPGHWYHVAAVVDREQGRCALYVNGKTEASASFAPGTEARAYAAEPWRLGLGNPDSHADYGWPANGVLKGVRLYDRALSAEEVAGLRP